MAACYHILPHTQVQRLMAGGLEEVSKGCCPVEAIAEPEVADTRGIRHRRLPGLRGTEEMADSRIVPDAPSGFHSRKKPVPVNEHVGPRCLGGMAPSYGVCCSGRMGVVAGMTK
jgi:hypothetical protein